MGTFSYFLGEMDIPEERREEFAQGGLKAAPGRRDADR